MKTIIINEDNHGMIGVVMTYDTAIEFLTRYGWLDGNCEVSADPNGNWLTQRIICCGSATRSPNWSCN